MEELVERANRLLPKYLPDASAAASADGRLRDEVNPRLVRHLTTLGLLNESGREGREARYSVRHLLQLLVARRLMAEGYTTGAIKKLTAGADDVTLGELLQRGSAMLNRAEDRSVAQGFADEARAPQSSASDAPASSTKEDASNPALDYLQSIRGGTSSGARIKRASPTIPPASLTRPASPETLPRWTRIEVEPGLELHVREDFRAPPTPHEREELLNRISEQLKVAAKNRAPRRKP